jgi:hypothetical protein
MKKESVSSGIAWQAGIEEKTIEMRLNSGGVRYTGRVLKIGSVCPKTRTV